MAEVYLISIMLAVTFLLICLAVARYPESADTQKMDKALHRPGILSRIGARQMMFENTIRKAGDYRQELLKEKNRSVFLFGILGGDRQEEECTAPKKR